MYFWKDLLAVPQDGKSILFAFICYAMLFFFLADFSYSFQVKCMQCLSSSNKFDPFIDLSLEIVKADSLYKALAHFTAEEQLDGGAKQYQCQHCKQKVRAHKQLTIHKAPYVLTIHLKRFGSYLVGQKIDKRIHFGPTLDLKPFVTDPYVSSLYDPILLKTLQKILGVCIMDFNHLMRKLNYIHHL